jgi:hypothetical protein
MSGPEIVKRVERADGRRALLIIARRDGLFCYREDRILEDEETFPYWIGGYPESGLFPSAVDAEQDARQSLEWLRNSN